MSHHASGPNFGFPRGDARLDMTDLYAFPKPGDPNKSILILNVHPSFRLDSPEPTTSEPFKPGALYEFKIDTNGDAVADICYSVQFASSKNGKQTATVRRVQGARAVGVCNDGEVIVEKAPVSVGRKPGDASRRLPLFLRLAQRSLLFRRERQFQSSCSLPETISSKTKMFAASCLNCPTQNSGLTRSEFGLAPWIRLADGLDPGRPRCEDHCRRSSSPERRKRTTLAGEPADDDRFVGVFAHELEHSGGYTPEDAKNGSRETLLPDILAL